MNPQLPRREDLPQRPTTVPSKSYPELPDIDDDQSFAELTRELSLYFVKAIETTHSFEQLRTSSVGHDLRPLITYLSKTVHHPAIVAALLSAHITIGSKT
ncbi:MAG: hypothetical protein M1830_006932, partial [Pleopsidium flavum]